MATDIEFYSRQQVMRVVKIFSNFFTALTMTSSSNDFFLGCSTSDPYLHQKSIFDNQPIDKLIAACIV